MAVARQIMPTHVARHRLGAGTTGCMGTGLPYAVGAKLARPDRQVVAILGDYAFGAAAMEVETCARWQIPVVIVVSNNGGIAAHTIQDRSFPADAPPIAALLPVDYERMVEMVGGYAERVTSPDQIRPALGRAFAAGTVASTQRCDRSEGETTGRRLPVAPSAPHGARGQPCRRLRHGAVVEGDSHDAFDHRGTGTSCKRTPARARRRAAAAAGVSGDRDERPA